MDIKKFWKKYGFEIILCICIFFILLVFLFNDKNGTWNKYIITYSKNKNKNKNNNNKNNIKNTNNINSNIASDSKGEIECRRVLESIFKRKFDKARPDFLRNPVTGNSFNLELDCYNSELRLAVEYQGCQHYKFTPFFHKNNEAFLNQKYRDYIKRQMCRDNNIILIEVPYTIKIKDIEKFILKELKNV